jgi:hypothetical protein
MGRIKFTDYIPQNLVGVNSASKTLAADNVTGMPISTGAVVGESFYISKITAALLSTVYYPLYEGWYRVVKVDTGATVANINFGSIGGQATLAKGEDTVTDQANVLSVGLAPCVFLTGGLGLIVSSAYVPALTAMTAGNYTVVQDAGDASVLLAANQAVSVGDVLVAAAGVGTVTKPSATVLEAVNTLSTVVGIAEAALTTPASGSGTAIALASGGVAVYTISLAGGASNGLAGQQAVITAAASHGSVNNGTFLITASTATTITLANAAAVADTTFTATLQGLVRVRLGFSFGQNL